MRHEMREPVVRSVGLAAVIGYAWIIGWLFASQPATVAEAVSGLSSSLGTYAIDGQAFADGLQFFRTDQFVEARAAFTRTDPAMRDSVTQFYIAYSYYREGWGRTRHDDALFTEGLAAVDRATALAPHGRVVVDDPNLQMRTADELC